MTPPRITWMAREETTPDGEVTFEGYLGGAQLFNIALARCSGLSRQYQLIFEWQGLSGPWRDDVRPLAERASIHPFHEQAREAAETLIDGLLDLFVKAGLVLPVEGG